MPEFGGEAAGKETTGRESGSATGQERTQTAVGESQRKRGRTPAEKENKRLKRCLFCLCKLHFYPLEVLMLNNGCVMGLFGNFYGEKVVEEQSFSAASKREEKGLLE